MQTEKTILTDLVYTLRYTLTEYRHIRRNEIVSKHINAIEIALCLVEYAIEDQRPISQNERNWFEASYQISYLLDGSEWEKSGALYSQLVTMVKSQNYFG